MLASVVSLNGTSHEFVARRTFAFLRELGLEHVDLPVKSDQEPSIVLSEVGGRTAGCMCCLVKMRGATNAIHSEARRTRRQMEINATSEGKLRIREASARGSLRRDPRGASKVHVSR